MKTKEINNHLYSREQFATYETRIKLTIEDTQYEKYNLDIYTDCKNTNKIHKAITSSVTDKVLTWRITHLATREQDERTKRIN